MPFRPPPAELWGASVDPETWLRLTLIGLAAFTAVWLAAVGASIGSFLNVVVYRLPRGMSLVRPKSRCPGCGASIRRGDNVPVLGWLRLRGRCRDCGTAIAARYPLVEALTAAVFLGLAHVELFSGAPFSSNPGTGLTWVLWHIRWETLTLYAFHLTLACLLLCVVLIAWDGHRPPRSLALTGLLLGLLPPVVLPFLHPAPAGWPVAAGLWSYQPQIGSPAGLFPMRLPIGLTGLAVGGLVGAAVSIAAATEQRRGTIVATAFVGLFLGWPAATAVGLLTAVAAWPLIPIARLARRPLPVTAAVAIAVAVRFAVGPPTGFGWLPGAEGWPVLRRVGWPEPGFAVTSSLAAVAVAAFLAWPACRIVPRTETVYATSAGTP